MAGGFGGNDSDYDYDDSVDDENEDVDIDEEDVSEEDEDEDLEEELTEEEQARNLAMRSRLKDIGAKAPLRFYPHLKDDEKVIVREAKKKPQFKVETARIEERVLERKAQFWQKVWGVIGPILPFLLIALLIILGALFIASAIDAIFGAIFGGGSSGSGDSGGMSSQFGVKGDKFYGNRVIYRDSAQARVDILGGFVDYLEGAIDSVPNGTDYNLIINVTLPSEDYDYSTFDETTFASTYADVYSMLAGDGTNDGIVDLVYRVDNPEGTATNLIEQIDAIKYFGMSAELNMSFADLVADYINTHTLYTATPHSSDTSINTAEVEENISTAITSYMSMRPTTRTEKLYIKDYIFSGADSMMSNVPKEDYVAFIFMPKTGVNFTSLSFAVLGVEPDNFTIQAMNGNSAIEFTQEVVDADKKAYIYTWSHLGSVHADTFTDIDTDNLEFLSKGKSLLDIVSTGENSELYLTTTTLDDSTEIVTAKISGLNIRLTSDREFSLVEYETKLS